MVSRIRRTSPVGFGDSKTWPTISLSSATAVSVEPISSASQIVRSFLRAPARRGAASRAGRRRPARRRGPGSRRHTRSSGRSSIRGRDQRQTAGRPSPKTGVSLGCPSNSRGRDRGRSPGRPTAGSAGCGAVTGLNFLLVLRSGRWRKRRPSSVLSGKSRLVDRVGAAARRAAHAGRRGRRRGGTRGWSRSRRPSWRPLGLRLTTICARKLASPNTSSISSRRCAASLSSMLTKTAPAAASTSRGGLEPRPHHRRPGGVPAGVRVGVEPSRKRSA